MQEVIDSVVRPASAENITEKLATKMLGELEAAVGRTIASPYEISAAIIMSVVGGPFFILLLRRSKQAYVG